MFTGIIETTGRVTDIRPEGKNSRFTIASSVSAELKIDQSVSHDGVCLTVVNVQDNTHEVVAVEETLNRSNFRFRKIGDTMNIERSMALNGRLDGHIVQGHVDDVAICRRIESREGSWLVSFKISPEQNYLLVDKGSVCINGVSLTVIQPAKKKFTVAIIPYTFEHTNFMGLAEGEAVNIEYDILGKYVARMVKHHKR